MSNIAGALAVVAPFTAGFESFSASPYPDGGSYAIGYGNHYYSDGTAVESTDSAISQGDAWDLMIFYLNQAAQAVLSALTVNQSNNQLAALTDLYYNCPACLSQVTGLINAGQPIAAVAQELAITGTTSGGVTNDTLVKRAAARAGLYQQTILSGSTLTVLGIVAGFLFIAGIVGTKK